MNKNSMKLGTRLSLAFATLVLLTVAVGGLALFQLASMNSRTLEIADNWLPSIKVLGEMRTAANQLRRQEADHVLSVDAAEMAIIEARMDKIRTTWAEKQKTYEPLIAFPEERAGYEEFKKHRDAYLAAQARLLEVSRGGDKTLQEAKSLFRGESRTAFDAMAAQVGQLVEFNNKGSAESAVAARDTYASAKLLTCLLVGAAVAVAASLAVVIVRSVTRQLGGEPADAAALAQRVADGDLSVAIAVRSGDHDSLIAALKRMQDSLCGIVTAVRANAENVATASAQISQGNNDLSGRTEEQASALEETAASMEQLSSTVKQNAENAAQGNQLAMEASGVAAQGGEVVSRVVETMKNINASSQKIAEIIGVIDGIAFQTNILALNAAVEAARAGEQGRGFAVVATEVRNLAQRSAEAAKQIKSLIQSSVETVEQGTELVDRAGTTMGEVVTSIRRVTSIMGEISTASAEQSSGVAQVGEAIAQMDKATQQNAALVEQSAAAAESLNSQAKQLLGAVAVFKLDGQSRARAVQPAAQIAPTATWKGSECKGAGRAANGVRPSFKASPVAVPTKPVKAATGTDEWTSF